MTTRHGNPHGDRRFRALSLAERGAYCSLLHEVDGAGDFLPVPRRTLMESVVLCLDVPADVAAGLVAGLAAGGMLTPTDDRLRLLVGTARGSKGGASSTERVRKMRALAKEREAAAETPRGTDHETVAGTPDETRVSETVTLPVPTVTATDNGTAAQRLRNTPQVLETTPETPKGNGQCNGNGTGTETPVSGAVTSVPSRASSPSVSSPLFLVAETTKLSKGKKAEGKDAGARDAVTADVTAVWNHWQRVMQHPTAKLDADRTKVITRALAGYDAATLCRAIDGCELSDFHMGREEGKPTRYDGVALIFRNAEHIERFAAMADAQAAADATDPWKTGRDYTAERHAREAAETLKQRTEASGGR